VRVVFNIVDVIELDHYLGYTLIHRLLQPQFKPLSINASSPDQSSPALHT